MAADGGPPTSAEKATVTVDGAPIRLGTLATVTRTIGFECTSGRWIEHEWTGIPVERLLADSDASGTATHVIVEAADGHTACPSLTAAVTGLLAIRQDDEPLVGPRFVSPDITGPRAVSDVIRLELVRLAPDEDPGDYESMDLVTD